MVRRLVGDLLMWAALAAGAAAALYAAELARSILSD